MSSNELFIESSNLPKPLTKDEIKALVIEMQNGSAEAREKLIIHNIRLVINEAVNKFSSYIIDKKDFVSVGIIGLIKAVDNFDLSKNIEFSSFAVKCIDNEILMFLNKNTKYLETDSIDRVISEDQDGSELRVIDLLVSDENIADDYEYSEVLDILISLVEKLPEKEQSIIKHYYGICNSKMMNQKDLATLIGVDKSVISKRQKAILEKLRAMLESRGVIEKKSNNGNTRKRQFL